MDSALKYFEMQKMVVWGRVKTQRWRAALASGRVREVGPAWDPPGCEEQSESDLKRSLTCLPAKPYVKCTNTSQLTSLGVKNGNNANIKYISST